jgi:hypothetical protein
LNWQTSGVNFPATQKEKELNNLENLYKENKNKKELISRKALAENLICKKTFR